MSIFGSIVSAIVGTAKAAQASYNIGRSPARDKTGRRTNDNGGAQPDGRARANGRINSGWRYTALSSGRRGRADEARRANAGKTRLAEVDRRLDEVVGSRQQPRRAQAACKRTELYRQHRRFRVHEHLAPQA